MSHVPAELKYTQTHEWVRQENDGSVTVGITEHAQSLLGDMVFVELPKVGARVNAGGEAGVVESVKAASDVYSPVEGEITAVNTELDNNPALVNTDPYQQGWLFKLKPADANALNNLLDAQAYAAHVAAEDH